MYSAHMQSPVGRTTPAKGAWHFSFTAPRSEGGRVLLLDAQAGTRHACAITAAGEVFCWGNNRNNYLGNADTKASFTPVAVSFAE